MMALIQVSVQLHSPVYFFLNYLSFVDFCSFTVIIAKMLPNMLNENKAISFLGCMVQCYLFCTCVVTVLFLLAVMSYNCFLANYSPLLYTIIMSPKDLHGAAFRLLLVCI